MLSLKSLVVAVLILAVPEVSGAQSLSPAPRAQYHAPEINHTEKKWERDYGLIDRCNREALGAALGAAIGGAIGAKIGADEHRAVAIIAATALGAAIGATIGRDLDEADRGCRPGPRSWRIAS
jgi:uncharacterized protein YcfJ